MNPRKPKPAKATSEGDVITLTADGHAVNPEFVLTTRINLERV